jgi:uncharacterized protein (TIGR03083 family)
VDAAEAVAELVGRIDGGWDGPGLGVWDLRSLVGHTSRSIVTVLTYLDRPAGREELRTPEAYVAASATMAADLAEQVAERGREAGRALGADPAAAFRALVQQVVTRLGDADDDALIETIAGGMRVGTYVSTRTFELVVHGLDIARATGLTVDLPEAALADATALAGRVAARLGKGPAVLAALTGRSSLPEGFSIV